MKLIKPLIVMILLFQLSACGQKGVLYTNSKSIESETTKQQTENKQIETNDESKP